MGADTFYDVAIGRTAEEAFSATVDDALHWNGHGGYTGSIAEKNDFVMISSSGRDVIEGIKAKIEELRHIVRTGQRVAVTRGLYRDTSTIHKVSEGDKAYYRREIAHLVELKKECRIRMKSEDIARALITLDDPRIDDKWGPAGCIEVKGKEAKEIKERMGVKKGARGKNVFLFFGWASM
jgi:hypothetical protein